eukprot:gene9641-12980_t
MIWVFVFLLVFIVTTSFVFFSATSLSTTTNKSKKSNNISSKNNLRASYSNSIKMQLSGVIPPIIYGTAWKKTRTKELVELAVRTGFRGIDTACQPKHYNEPGVGEALENLYANNIIKREDLFLQTKFTSIRGQDPTSIPYDISKSLHDQVRESFTISCANLKTTYLDSLVMHSPMERFSDTMIVWRAFEEIYKEGGTKRIGLSNTYDFKLLKKLYEDAEIKPSVLQNRFYRDSGYDREIREFCLHHNIQYESFWTLTANPHILKSSELRSLSLKYGFTQEQIFFRFIQSIGIVPLSGTTSNQHMLEDLQASSIDLTQDEINTINSLLG